MPPVLIENPILNSPSGEPTRHFRDEPRQVVNAGNEEQNVGIISAFDLL